jgi:hypothetical protein
MSWITAWMAALVGGFLKAEIGGKGLVVVRRVAEGMAFAGGAAGVDVQQLGGGVAHLLGGLAPGLVPLAAAQLVQRRLVGADAGVAADQLQLADRHVQRGLVGVFEVQELLQCRFAVRVLLAQVQVDQAPVAADAVGGMHHRVADVQLAQVLDQRLDIADLFLLLAPARGGAGGKQLGLGDELDRCPSSSQLKPVVSARWRCRRVVAGLELGQRVEGRRADAAGAQEIEQAFAAAVALGQQQHAVLACCAQVGLQPGQRLVGAAHHGEVAEFLASGRCRPRPSTAGRGCELGVFVGAGVELLDAQEQRLGRQHRAFGVALHQAVALLGVLPEVLEGRLQVAVQHHRGVGAQVVEHGGGVVEEQRQVVLDAGRGHAVAHVLVDAALGGVAFEQLAPAAAELGPRGVVHRELAARQQAHLGHRVQAALAVGVEGADAVDLVVEQVHAVGHQASPWGTGRSARRAPRIRRGSPPGSRGCSRPGSAGP